MDISEKSVLVTGGSSGIGKSIAIRFSELGNEVVVCGRDSMKLMDLSNEYPRIKTVECDIRKTDATNALADRFGEKISLLINCAGICQELSLFEDASLELQLEEIDINLNGMVRILHAFLPKMCLMEEAAVVNVTSATAFVAEAKSPVYSSTKAAQHALTMALRHQLRNTNVKVFELIPPLTDTPMATHHRGIPKLAPEKVVEALVRGLKNDRLEIAPGLATAAWLMSRIAPKFAFDKLNR